jgi:hypothetical protein
MAHSTLVNHGKHPLPSSPSRKERVLLGQRTKATTLDDVAPVSHETQALTTEIELPMVVPRIDVAKTKPGVVPLPLGTKLVAHAGPRRRRLPEPPQEAHPARARRWPDHGGDAHHQPREGGVAPVGRTRWKMSLCSSRFQVSHYIYT